MAYQQHCIAHLIFHYFLMMHFKTLLERAHSNKKKKIGEKNEFLTNFNWYLGILNAPHCTWQGRLPLAITVMSVLEWIMNAAHSMWMSYMAQMWQGQLLLAITVSSILSVEQSISHHGFHRLLMTCTPNLPSSPNYLSHAPSATRTKVTISPKQSSHISSSMTLRPDIRPIYHLTGW
jgi:hypothetical protein